VSVEGATVSPTREKNADPAPSVDRPPVCRWSGLRNLLAHTTP